MVQTENKISVMFVGHRANAKAGNQFIRCFVVFMENAGHYCLAKKREKAVQPAFSTGFQTRHVNGSESPGLIYKMENATLKALLSLTQFNDREAVMGSGIHCGRN